MHYVIVGNGITGITAARTLRKGDDECRISIISAETKYFYSRTALMYVYMGHMTFEQTKPYEDSFWSKNRLDLIHDSVISIDFDNKSIELKSGQRLSYDKLLLATGSKSNKFDWPGQDLNGVQGLYSYQDLELLEKNTHKAGTSINKQHVKKAVVVGGGLIGVELAEMLISRNIHVTFLIRENKFWGSVLPEEESSLVIAHLKDHGVEFIFNDELQEVKGDAIGKVTKVLTKKGQSIDCQLVGLTVGVSPNVDFLKKSKLEIGRGIKVKLNLETSIPDVYSAGDCAEFREAPKGRKNIEQVWYTGRSMGEVAAWNMMGKNVNYEPGPWFNSAKFFDLEYQTYGMVGNRISEGENSFYWESKDNKKCLKVIFNSTNREMIGVNAFGIRLRHEILNKMLINRSSSDLFIENFQDINFDAEFSKDHSMEIVQKYNEENNTSIKVKKKKWISQLFS